MWGRRVCLLALCGVAVAAEAASPEVAPAVPAEELTLTLPRAIAMALARNYTIRIDSFGPKIAQARVREALGAFDPIVTVRAQRSDNNNPQLLSPTLEAGGTVQTVNEALNADVRELTPLGGIISLGASTERQSGAGDAQYNSFAGVTITQPLLRDFGLGAALNPLRLARKDRETARWTFRQTLTDIITETAQAYEDAYFARENLGVAQRSRELAARLLEDNTQRVKIGVLTPLDISVARSQLAAREEAIINARQTLRELENALKLRVTDAVERFMAVRLHIAQPVDHDPGPVDFNVDLPHAFAWRPDYRERLLDLDRRQIALVFDRNQAMARLDLSASLGSNGLSRTVGDSLAAAFRGDNLAASAGLNLTIPIPNRSGRARVEESQLAIAQALVGLKRLEQQIIVLLDNAAGAVRSGRARIAASAEALRLARESLDAENRKLTEGTSTSFVVLQLQNDLATAESNALRARTDYHKAVVAYEREAGRTLDVHRVKVEAGE